MNGKKILFSGLAVAVALGAPVWAATTTVQIGASGKTFASSVVQCATNPDTLVQEPVVEAGLFNPKEGTTATVSLNGTVEATVTSAGPTTNVWLADGNNTVDVALSKKTADRYTFAVQQGYCNLPDTSANMISADGTLEYAASGKSYATVKPGCALNGKTGRVQPFVNLFDTGNYLLNVSVNGVALTQLSSLHPSTPVFLSAGKNVISAVNGSLSTDYYVRDGGDGTCVLQP